MTGTLAIVGLGPAGPELMTAAALQAVSEATDIVGYTTYVERIALRPDQRVHASGNRVEIERARLALSLAAAGKRVAVVSGGDPGVFAMAAAVFEAVESSEALWRDIDIRVEPGVSAMLAAAAELGAPLGGDFCAISLSDNLKSWATITRRLEAAAVADFVIALYNPASKARPRQLSEAFGILRRHKSSDCPVALVRAAGAPACAVHISTLAAVDPSIADMRTLVFIGSSATRILQRSNGAVWVYTPRSEEGVPR